MVKGEIQEATVIETKLPSFNREINTLNKVDKFMNSSKIISFRLENSMRRRRKQKEIF